MPADLAARSISSATRDRVRRPWRGAVGATDLCPGLLLTVTIAAIAFALRLLPVFGALSPLILAIALGMVVRNAIGMPAVVAYAVWGAR